MDGADAIDAAVNVTANVSTAATVNVTGHGSEVGYDYIYWEIEVNAPSHIATYNTPSLTSPLPPYSIPCTTPFQQVLHHSDDINPCSLPSLTHPLTLPITTHYHM